MPHVGFASDSQSLLRQSTYIVLPSCSDIEATAQIQARHLEREPLAFLSFLFIQSYPFHSSR